MYGMNAFGYQPFGTTAQMLQSGHPDVQAAGENIAGAYGRDLSREQHEQGLQQSEQSRRQYDSETARMMGMKKLGVLRGLMSGRSQVGGSGMGSYG